MRPRLQHIIAATLAASMVSCREELCYNHFGSADIDIEWSVSGGQQPSPSGATVITYDNNGQPVEMFLPSDGGSLNFGDNGVQSMLIYNNDTEKITLFGISDGPRSVHATSTPGYRPAPQTLASRHPGEATLNTPDMLYAAYIEAVPDADRHEIAALPVDMKPMVFSYTVRYNFEYGFERVTNARGALGGMAARVMLYNGETPDDAAILVYDCRLDNNAVVASVLSFGIPSFVPGETDRNRRENRAYTLNLEVTLTNGKTKSFDIDVAEQLQTQPRGGNITVSGLRIEDSDSGTDSGFEPDLDDWNNNVDIDLPVGGQK